MKNFFIFSICILFSWTSKSQGIKFAKADLEKVFYEADLQDKYIFIDCTTTWCKPCKWMKRNVFTEKSVGQFFNSNFLNVELDMEKEPGLTIAKKYQVHAYPTFLFLDSKGNLVHRSGGLTHTDDFILLAKTALDTSNNLFGMTSQYERGNRSAKLLRSYIPALGKAHQEEKQKKVFKSYFLNSDKSKLFNLADFEVIMSTAKPRDSSFRFLIHNRKNYIALMGRNTFDSLVSRKLIAFFSMPPIGNDIALIKSNAEDLESLYPEVVKNVSDNMIIRYYRRKKITDSLIQSVLQYFQSYNMAGSSELVTLTNWVLEAPAVDSDKYDGICNFIKNAYLTTPNNYALADVYAGLLIMTGQTESAEKLAGVVLKNFPEKSQDKLWSSKILNNNKPFN